MLRKYKCILTCKVEDRVEDDVTICMHNLYAVIYRVFDSQRCLRKLITVFNSTVHTGAC